jgi:hypothetical protein
MNGSVGSASVFAAGVTGTRENDVVDGMVGADGSCMLGVCGVAAGRREACETDTGVRGA